MSILVDTNIHVIAAPEERSKYPLNIYPGTEDEFSESQTNRPEDFVKEMDEGGLDQAVQHLDVVVVAGLHGRLLVGGLSPQNRPAPRKVAS